MFNFLKNAIFRGLVVLIPVVILYVTIRELLQLMVALATPIADLFPVGTFDHQKETEIIAALLVAGTALFARHTGVGETQPPGWENGWKTGL